jgi:hypothetical protein
MRKSKTVVASVALFILASLCYAKDDASKNYFFAEWPTKAVATPREMRMPPLT